jgi:hypothetical protein
MSHFFGVRLSVGIVTLSLFCLAGLRSQAALDRMIRQLALDVKL